MNVLSLFAGIGGLDLGLERAGMTVVGQVEINPWCRKVLAKHWPEVPRHDDVRTCVEWWLGEPRPAVDVVCGGFPCQPVSLAGRRLAQADERWLWPFVAAVVGQLRPRYLIVENVPGLFTAGFADVLGDLAALGFDAEWDCVPAAAVGAPHRRDRLFLVAHSGGAAGRRAARTPEPRVGEPPLRERATESGRRSRDVADAERELGHPCGAGDIKQGSRGRHVGRSGVGANVAYPDGNGWSERPDVSPTPGRDDGAVAARGGTPVADPHGSRREPWGGLGRPWPAPVRDGWWATEPDVGRVAHGIPARVDRLRGLGNAVVPQVAEHVGRLVMAVAS